MNKCTTPLLFYTYKIIVNKQMDQFILMVTELIIKSVAFIRHFENCTMNPGLRFELLPTV